MNFSRSSTRNEEALPSLARNSPFRDGLESHPSDRPSPWPFTVVGEESWNALGVLELARARVAQIHQCPESLACHTASLRARGDGACLDELETWQTSTLFNDAQRAALALCDHIVLAPAKPLPDTLLQDMHRYFTNDGIVSVTVAIVAAAEWNFSHSPHFGTDQFES